MLSTGCVGNNKNIHNETKNKPIIFVAEGLNNDGSLVKNYKRGLDYAIDYFGNYGPYYVYLMGPSNKQNILDIYLSRAKTRATPIPSSSRRKQIEEFLKRPNVTSEIEAVLEGKEEGGLTWSESPVRVYEDVTTNATERENNPIENTWGALHEYHHVFQIAHCDSYEKRTSDKNLNSWMTEGGATYSSAKFMENLNLVDFRKYMLELLKNGGNISQIGINDFLLSGKEWNLDNETYWEKDYFPQVYYMLGAWATAYLIHVEGAKEITVLKNWYFDVPRIGKSAAFEKHMGLSLNKFYSKFDSFIRQPNEDLMNIFKDK
tara:strand:+ start:52 stop:1005 length:954 start_codon:yes stop_codon:yes gene_type:complete